MIGQEGRKTQLRTVANIETEDEKRWIVSLRMNGKFSVRHIPFKDVCLYRVDWQGVSIMDD
jgi:hypothetical protein